LGIGVPSKLPCKNWSTGEFFEPSIGFVNAPFRGPSFGECYKLVLHIICIDEFFIQ
jgi:hypothetical protein